MPFCTQCRASLEANAKFCSNCGAVQSNKANVDEEAATERFKTNPDVLPTEIVAATTRMKTNSAAPAGNNSRFIIGVAIFTITSIVGIAIGLVIRDRLRP